MKRPAIFFDRDNTLIVSDGYLGDPAQVELVEGAAKAVARAKELGYSVVVFSNQSGVARGLFSEDDVHAVNARLDDMLRAAQPAAIIDRHEFCPFHPEATIEEYRRESDLRKPRPGMIHAAAQRLDLDLVRSWVIGDAPRDIAAGRAAGCRTILFRDGALSASPAAAEETAPDAIPDTTVASLREAIEYVETTSEPVHQRVRAKPVQRPPAANAADELSPVVGKREADEAGAADSAESATSSPRRDRALPEPHVEDPPRLERLAEQILHELRARHEAPPHADFSVPRLLGGIAQVVALAVLFVSYLNRGTADFQPLLVLALFFQTLTIALLIMGRLR